jgi:hypothetical protein
VSAPGSEPTGYEQPPDERPDDSTPGEEPTADGEPALTTDAEAQSDDDMPARPGNEAS